MKKLIFILVCMFFVIRCQAGIIIVAPNGGEELISGQTEIITWDTVGDINNVKIKFSDSNGQTWTDVNSSMPNNGSYDWLIPEVTSQNCLVQVSDANNAGVNDISDNVFSVYVCQLNSLADLDKNCKVDFIDFSILALDWLGNGNPFDENYTEPLPIMWVYINDPGVSGHEGFTGYMSKYETTNAQYCAYLNSAKASGDIIVDSSYVKGASGPYSGQKYYYLAGSGHTCDGTINGGAARINWTGSSFTVDSGFENHPVTYVSWYGSTAFASYYGWRLPTEWEWQAVADHYGEFNYGCGVSINNSIANYNNSTHPYGTTVVGSFGTYGYGMCDMAGNVWEWTSSLWGPGYSSRVVRGGSWLYHDYYCTVSLRLNNYPSNLSHYLGFHVCR